MIILAMYGTSFNQPKTVMQVQFLGGTLDGTRREIKEGNSFSKISPITLAEDLPQGGRMTETWEPLYYTHNGSRQVFKTNHIFYPENVPIWVLVSIKVEEPSY